MRHLTLTMLPLLLAAPLAGCGDAGEQPAPAQQAEAEGEHHDASAVTLTPQQIAAAGITLVRPSIGGGGAIELPATIAGDPQALRIVPAAIGGRVELLTRNLGDQVRAGQTLAIIASREAAQMGGDLAAAQARAGLARSNLAREQRLFAARVSPEQDLIAARAAAAEADAGVRQARGQLAAAGGGGGGFNRIAIASPMAGQIIARSVTLGQTVAADTELYRVANLATVSLALSLTPQDAGAVKPGSGITVTAPGRQAQARVTFVSPILDAETRMVPVIASLDNRDGRWRVGENVRVSVRLPSTGGSGAIGVPQVAVQTIEGKPVVFVRTPTGFMATPVRPGPAEGDRVTILAGLSGREEIAAANSFVLKAELGKGEAGHED